MNPLVSICCTAFNHEKYIEETLNGFLIQKTTFPIEIIVHDDASTDNTANIIKSYAEQDDRIVTIFQTENQFSQNKKPWASFVFPKAKGKYIALCEGDDYWTDPLKLQKQVDFLENNLDYALCAHSIRIYNQTTGEFSPDNINVKETTENSDLAQRCYLQTNTVVLRNNFKLENWFNYMPVGDWPLFLMQTTSGKIMRFKEIMSVYRIHDNGIWSKLNRYNSIKTTIRTVESMLEHIDLPVKSENILKKKLKKYRFKLKKEAIRNSFKRKNNNE